MKSKNMFALFLLLCPFSVAAMQSPPAFHYTHSTHPLPAEWLEADREDDFERYVAKESPSCIVRALSDKICHLFSRSRQNDISDRLMHHIHTLIGICRQSLVEANYRLRHTPIDEAAALRALLVKLEERFVAMWDMRVRNHRDAFEHFAVAPAPQVTYVEQARRIDALIQFMQRVAFLRDVIINNPDFNDFPLERHQLGVRVDQLMIDMQRQLQMMQQVHAPIDRAADALLQLHRAAAQHAAMSIF